MSGLSIGVAQGFKAYNISFHLGLNVKVSKMLGLPNLRIIAMASITESYFTSLYQKKMGKCIYFLLANYFHESDLLQSLGSPLYYSHLNSV